MDRLIMKETWENLQYFKDALEGRRDGEVVLISVESINWLIQTIENLKYYNKLSSKYIGTIKRLQGIQIQNYEDALKQIKDGSIKDDYYSGWSYDIANKALEYLKGDNKFSNLQDIKEYYNEQNDRMAIAEFQYVNWLIETVEKYEQENTYLKQNTIPKEFETGELLIQISLLEEENNKLREELSKR